MMRDFHVFDLDGTLLDTKAATMQAYRAAAAELSMAAPPENIWGHTASEWQCPPALHAAKLVHYSLLVPTLVKPAWAAETYMRLMAEGTDIRVVTGASKGTVEVLSRTRFRDYLRGVAAGLTIQDKVCILQGMVAVYADVRIHYYDDNPAHGHAITKDVLKAVLHTPPKAGVVCA